MIKLSVVIPAYNEEKRLPKTLKAVDSYLKKQKYSYEIIVVSDGSKDKTVQVVQGLSIKNLRVIDNKQNHGKGYVVRQGMLKAKGEYRLFMDADNATTINHVEGMWPEFEKGNEIVICSRDIKGSVIAVPQPLWRRKLGDVFNLIVQVLSGLWGIWDTQCGFKGFSKKAVQDIFPKAVIDRWAFDVELLVIAKKQGYNIIEIPVTWINDAESKVSFKGMVKMLLEVIDIRFNMLKKIYG
ncbi:MAG: glycosyltransferase family 2 protein [Patescibacteria group bacterium]|nr:glycosyltransferase family 2 protein [Patescibacteria group bacterium]